MHTASASAADRATVWGRDRPIREFKSRCIIFITTDLCDPVMVLLPRFYAGPPAALKTLPLPDFGPREVRGLVQPTRQLAPIIHQLEQRGIRQRILG